ncbi:hypothetical protein FQN53_004381 [Emmonsiellopsis sp. PD_33]|nr:hypothetical protein FQN53_004381 [Emmonsiellopsis sp. PD_33]
MAALDTVAAFMTAEGPAQLLPGVAMIAADDKGNIRYSKSFGSNDKGPVTIDTPMWIASCSKLITTIAFLQSVEKGLVNLDDTVEKILPELAEPDVLQGYDEATGAPLLRKAKNKITFRHLATHSSGLGYDSFDPRLVKWREATKTSSPGPIGDITKMVFPLLFEPGEAWVYGVSIDWLGKAVERLNGNISLGAYFKEHIFEPLGIHHTTFRPNEDAYFRDNLPTEVIRDQAGELTLRKEPFMRRDQVDDVGGNGLFSTASDYIKVLISILKNDKKLLKQQTVDMMFEPHLSAPEGLAAALKVNRYITRGMTNGLSADTKWDFGLGGILAMEETPNRRSKGTLAWSGLPNWCWWIDRERGTCGVSGMQLEPTFDQQALALFGQFETLAWQGFAEQSSGI